MRNMSHWLVVALAGLTFQACATATRADADASNGTKDGPQKDAPATIDARPDAPNVDAPPVDRTLKQTTVDTITVNNSQVCGNVNGTSENSYYRVFKLSDFGITTAFNVTAVSFGVENATAGGVATSQPVQVKLSNYTGSLAGTTLTTSALTLINAINISVDNVATPAITTTPITGIVPIGGTLVVEIASPDGTAIGNKFYLGSNAGGESAPGYLRAPACSNATPKKWTAVGVTSTMHLVISVTGH
jgi:hypothetical protein